MPQYVVKLVHSPDQCPTANSKVRERMMKSTPEMPKLAGKFGIKFIAGPLLLMTEHETIAIVEASSAETVSDFIVESGLMQWNSVRISAAKSTEEAMKAMEKAPPPLY